MKKQANKPRKPQKRRKHRISDLRQKDHVPRCYQEKELGAADMAVLATLDTALISKARHCHRGMVPLYAISQVIQARLPLNAFRDWDTKEPVSAIVARRMQRP